MIRALCLRALKWGSGKRKNIFESWSSVVIRKVDKVARSVNTSAYLAFFEKIRQKLHGVCAIRPWKTVRIGAYPTKRGVLDLPDNADVLILIGMRFAQSHYLVVHVLCDLHPNFHSFDDIKMLVL